MWFKHKEPRVRFWNSSAPNFSFENLILQHTQKHNSSIMQLGKDKAARLSFLQSMSFLTSCAADSETNLIDSMKSIQNILQFGIDNAYSSSSNSDTQPSSSHPTRTCNTLPIGKFITIVYPPYTIIRKLHHEARLRFWMVKWVLSKWIHRTNSKQCTPWYGSLKVDLDSHVRFCTNPHRSLQWSSSIKTL